MITLILGGMRSGKTKMASLLTKDKEEVIYIATATAGDSEMSKRIDCHKKDRPKSWITIEEPLDISSILSQFRLTDKTIIIDCLTLWVTNILLTESSEKTFQSYKKQFLEELQKQQSHVIIISNETNSGVVPSSDLARKFCDFIGFLHQDLATISDDVVLMVAGIPTWIKNHDG